MYYVICYMSDTVIDWWLTVQPDPAGLSHIQHSHCTLSIGKSIAIQELNQPLRNGLELF